VLGPPGGYRAGVHHHDLKINQPAGPSMFSRPGDALRHNSQNTHVTSPLDRPKSKRKPPKVILQLQMSLAYRSLPSADFARYSISASIEGSIQMPRCAIFSWQGTAHLKATGPASVS
jgi:hypothetical protein